MSDTLHRATQNMTEADLPRMVLDRHELPRALQDFSTVRLETLDNDTMARQGFPDSSAERFRALGRLTGYLHELVAPLPEDETVSAGSDLAAATVVHLFEDASGVSRWMAEIFLEGFSAHRDQELPSGQRLLMVQRLTLQGFADDAAGLRVLQSSPHGPLSSTIIDFRVGRVLGVAYVVSMGNCDRQSLVTRLAGDLARKIVRVVLEVPR